MFVIQTEKRLLSQLQFQIRHLLHSDLPSLEWEGEYTHFRRLYREIYRSACDDRAVIWVADLGGSEVIGQLLVQLESARVELADGDNCAYFYGFRVKDNYRGQGVGSRLLKNAEVDLYGRKFRWITLNVSRDNLETRRYYEKRGFRIVAPEPGKWSYIDDQGAHIEVHEPSWRMKKRIIPQQC